jgi:hypothetical protein
MCKQISKDISNVKLVLPLRLGLVFVMVVFLITGIILAGNSLDVMAQPEEGLKN